MLNGKKFKSSDNMTDIYYVEHLPKTAPKACLIIAHGIGEHTGRYNEISDFMVQNEVAVFVFDFIGHGQSVSPQKAPMYFGENGWDFLVKDLITLNAIVKNKYPDTPCFIFGFSMGSFVLRTALAENAKEFISTLNKLKPTAAKGVYIKSVYLSSTMSQGVKVDPKSAE